ncbi:MAG: acyltransferase family protein [Desulfomicrobium sp.]
MASNNWNIPYADKAWVIVTYALLFFSFTSGYFTSLRYGVNFDIKKFWKNKLYRIGVEYTLLNIFFVFLFLVQKKENIFSFHSLISWLGLNGFLTWFGVHNQSPFGAGLWFLTLLILFYIAYPVIAHACQIKTRAWVFVVFFTAMMIYLDAKVIYNHMLWITACGFVLGVFFNSQKIFFSFRMCLCIIFVELICIFIAFCLNLNIRTSHIVLATSIPLILMFFLFKIPSFIHHMVRPVRSTVLGIYILHVYIFTYLTNIFIIDYIISLLITIFIAYIINTLSNKIVHKLYE